TIARDQLAAHLRGGAGQGVDHLVRGQRRSSARCRDHHRPCRRRSARRHSLRDAAPCPLRRDRHLPRVVCALQYARGGGRPCAGFNQGTGFLRMTEPNDASTPAAEKPASAPLAPEQVSALPEGELARLTDDIIAALKTVYDPEIPSDIYELGLIYKIDIADDRAVAIEMTLTTPNCPSAQELPGMVEDAVASVPGVGAVKVDIVWDPPWDPSRMSDEARAVLNMWQRQGSGGQASGMRKEALRADVLIPDSCCPIHDLCPASTAFWRLASMSTISTGRRVFTSTCWGSTCLPMMRAFARTTWAGEACCSCFGGARRCRRSACPAA